MRVWKQIIAFMMVALLMLAAPVAFAAEADAPDTTKLEELLHIASCAKEANYTAESWEALELAVEEANAAIESGSPLRVNNAVIQLATALSQLTSMNFADLNAIAKEVNQYQVAAFDQWVQLFQLVLDYQNAYASGDQAAVDQAVEDIREGLDRLQEGDLLIPEETPGEQTEQPVRKAPVVWIVLLCVSVLGNAALIAYIVLRNKERKTVQVDDVPLVDYDIDDDVV